MMQDNLYSCERSTGFWSTSNVDLNSVTETDTPKDTEVQDEEIPNKTNITSLKADQYLANMTQLNSLGECNLQVRIFETLQCTELGDFKGIQADIPVHKERLKQPHQGTTAGLYGEASSRNEQVSEEPSVTFPFPDGSSNTIHGDVLTCSKVHDCITALTIERLLTSDSNTGDLTSNFNKTDGTCLEFVSYEATASSDCTLINQSRDTTDIIPDVTAAASLNQEVGSGSYLEERPMIGVESGRDSLNKNKSTATPLGLESQTDMASKTEINKDLFFALPGLDTLSPVSPVQKSLPPVTLSNGLQAQTEGALVKDREKNPEMKQENLRWKKPIGINNSKKLRRGWEPRAQFKPKGLFLEQLTQLFSLDDKKDMEKEHDDNKLEKGITGEDKKSAARPEDSQKATNEALNAFKAFFTPKELKVDSADHMGLEAMRKKMKADMEKLRSFFEKPYARTIAASDSKSVPTSSREQSTPGRLQTVWPPPRSQDDDVRLGLKYTEAEHQTALLQLKRECKEEMEELRAGYELQRSQLQEEHADSKSRLMETITELQARLAINTLKDREMREVVMLTRDSFQPKTFHNVLIQTEPGDFTPNPEYENSSTSQSPKKLSHISIRESLQRKDEYAVDLLSPSASASSSQSLLPNSICPPLPLPPPPPSSGACPDAGHPSSFEFVPPPPPPLPTLGLTSSPPVSELPGADHSSNHLVEYVPRKPVVEPTQPMKPLYWTRIQIQANKNDTLWSSLEEPPILNTKEFEDLFSKNIMQPKKKSLRKSYEEGPKVKKTVKLLQGSRSQTVGILISSLHLEMKDIQQAVLMLDNSVVDLGTIEALYEIRAQNDELEKIREYIRSCKEDERRLLDKPEQFLYDLSQIPDFSDRASCMIFQCTFLDMATSIHCKVDVISRVCKENCISLVGYVSSYYLRNKTDGGDSNDFPLPEPNDLFLAAQVRFSDLFSDLRFLKSKLAACEKDVQKVCRNTLVEHLQPFKDKMEAFVLKANMELNELNNCLTSAQQSFQEMVSYFDLKSTLGEKEVTPNFIFMLWFEFSNDVKRAWEQEKKQLCLEKFKEVQLSVTKIIAEKKVETREVAPSGLKERLRQKEANMFLK
nr:formin-like [Paramormyrops kingsleyae]